MVWLRDGEFCRSCFRRSRRASRPYQGLALQGRDGRPCRPGLRSKGTDTKGAPAVHISAVAKSPATLPTDVGTSNTQLTTSMMNDPTSPYYARAN